MKKNYQLPEIAMICLEATDVIATSLISLEDGIGVNADNLFG